MAVRDEQTTRAIRRMRRTLDDAGASLSQCRVLALCSGGIDSSVLIPLLGRMPRGAAPASVDVLFMDHRIRSAEAVRAERDAAARVAESCGFSFHEVQRADAEREAEVGGAQAGARAWRYARAAELARTLGCDTVVTGHSADDQLECALLGLIGATAQQPVAMRVARPLRSHADPIRLVRPMLGLARSSIETIARELDVVHADDPSNDDPDAYLRNAVRHRVVPPLLDAHPAAGMVVARSAEQARERSDALEQLAQHVLNGLGAGATLDVRSLASLGGAARRAVLAAFLQRELQPHVPPRTVDARLVRAVDALAVRPGRAACARLDVAGAACVRRTGYDLAVVCPPPKTPTGVDHP